jgi:hypothetical protein
MALVAATALGMAWMRVVYPGQLRPLSGHFAGWLLQGPSTCLAVTFAALLVVLRLQSPRPRRRRLMIQPGFVACLASLVSLLLEVGCGVFFRMVHTFAPDEKFVYDASVFWRWGVSAPPAFVVGAWSGLWLSGRWAPEGSWIDRAGRALGLFWAAGWAWSLAGPILDYYLPIL